MCNRNYSNKATKNEEEFSYGKFYCLVSKLKFGNSIYVILIVFYAVIKRLERTVGFITIPSMIKQGVQVAFSERAFSLHFFFEQSSFVFVFAEKYFRVAA